MALPFLGRLQPWQYLMLLLSFVLIFIEGFVRIVTLALPTPIINVLYRGSRRLFNALSSPQGRKSRNKKKVVWTAIAQASDFVEMCELFGYYAEEHIVQTKDGYLLGLHRLAWRRGEEAERVNSGPASMQKRVVYLHHGLLMNSEVWVCLTERERSLPFLLVERGYDVWLGNNRGNKYSKKSTKHAPTETEFWSFSIDQFAFHDIPDSIEYILSTTHQPSLSYIGFSQGTAQAFATLSIHPVLNEKVDLFVALAPAMAPSGFTSGIVDSFVKTSPDVLFLAFGRRAILTSTTMWQALLYPPIYVRLIDLSLKFLFGWKSKNITLHQKLAAYPHLYSFTSTKSVVHWFQIIRNGKFQMYDDDLQAPFSISDAARYYKVAKFPTRNIKTPIVLVYGGSDSLVDIDVMLKELPQHAVVKEIPHYEHLDFLWASDVEDQVFPHVFAALDTYGNQDDDKARTRKSAPRFQPFTKLHDAISPFSDEDDEETSGSGPFKHSQTIGGSGRQAALDHRSSPTHRNKPKPTATTTNAPPRITPSSALSASASHFTEHTSTSRPEGWWSSDDVAGTEPSTPMSKTPTTRRSAEKLHKLYAAGNAETEPREEPAALGEADLQRATDGRGTASSEHARRPASKKSSIESFGNRGIRLGTAKAVGGLSMDVGRSVASLEGVATAASVSSGSEGKRRTRRRRQEEVL